MTSLSPQAQSVLDAFTEDNCLHDWKHNHYNIEALAAALRAAVAHTQQHRGLGVWECDADELLAIAAELEQSL
jgi:hypothetical protein